MSDHVETLEALKNHPKLNKGGTILAMGGDAIRAMLEDNERLRAALIPAEEWMAEDGCDCGTDEPGTCALCLVRGVLRGEK